LIEPAVTVKVALLAAAKTVTLVGVVSALLLSESVMLAPDAGAAPVKVTVQVPLAPEERLDGLHFKDETFSEGAIVRDTVFELPFKLAVNTAVWVETTLPAEAVKVPEVAAAGIVRAVGVFRLELLSESATTIPPEEAGLFSPTVQELLPPETRAIGLQTIEDTRVDAVKLTVVV
jgi:hypothetical protein